MCDFRCVIHKIRCKFMVGVLTKSDKCNMFGFPPLLSLIFSPSSPPLARSILPLSSHFFSLLHALNVFSHLIHSTSLARVPWIAPLSLSLSLSLSLVVRDYVQYFGSEQKVHAVFALTLTLTHPHPPSHTLDWFIWLINIKMSNFNLVHFIWNHRHSYACTIIIMANRARLRCVACQILPPQSPLTNAPA
jgi:hypothetical protein